MYPADPMSLDFLDAMLTLCTHRVEYLLVQIKSCYAACWGHNPLLDLAGLAVAMASVTCAVHCVIC